MRSRTLVRAIELVRRHNGYAMPRTGTFVYNLMRRGLPDKAEVELLPGVRTELDLRQSVELHSWLQGRRYERPTTERLDDWTANATCFFDVGANYGFFALRAAQAGCPAVHAFEPNPDLHGRLVATRDRNGLAALHCHHLGLADAPATLTLSLRDEELGHSSFGPRTWDDGRTVEVEVDTFDAWRASMGIDLPSTPTWVTKIDVEGYELHVLDGMADALAAQAFAGIVVELNELTLISCGASSAAVVERLARDGYVPLDPLEPTEIANAFFVPRRESDQGR